MIQDQQKQNSAPQQENEKEAEPPANEPLVQIVEEINDNDQVPLNVQPKSTL
jgi:hypothetical protein